MITNFLWLQLEEVHPDNIWLQKDYAIGLIHFDGSITFDALFMAIIMNPDRLLF